MVPGKLEDKNSYRVELGSQTDDMDAKRSPDDTESALSLQETKYLPPNLPRATLCEVLNDPNSDWSKIQAAIKAEGAVTNDALREAINADAGPYSSPVPDTVTHQECVGDGGDPIELLRVVKNSISSVVDSFATLGDSTDQLGRNVIDSKENWEEGNDSSGSGLDLIVDFKSRDVTNMGDSDFNGSGDEDGIISALGGVGHISIKNHSLKTEEGSPDSSNTPPLPRSHMFSRFVKSFSNRNMLGKGGSHQNIDHSDLDTDVVRQAVLKNITAKDKKNVDALCTSKKPSKYFLFGQGNFDKDDHVASTGTPIVGGGKSTNMDSLSFYHHARLVPKRSSQVGLRCSTIMTGELIKELETLAELEDDSDEVPPYWPGNNT